MDVSEHQIVTLLAGLGFAVANRLNKEAVGLGMLRGKQLAQSDT